MKRTEQAKSRGTVTITGPCKTLTVTSANPAPPCCSFCRGLIIDHVVRQDGELFCSQGCALSARG